MLMQTPCDCQAENVCWLLSQGTQCNRPLHKSSFAAKVRWDTWAQKEGCCRTIGPPPKICINCPAHFLKKHSRTVPVFFTPDELRVAKKDKDKRDREEQSEKRFIRLPTVSENNGSSNPKYRTRRNTDCCFPRPPSRMGLFRSPREKPYEVRYKQKMPTDCECDQYMWEEFIRATAAQMDKHRGRHNNRINRGQNYDDNDDDQNQGPQKDYIHANALQAVRMPPKRVRRCYVDQCGVHLIDMSDSPFVLRPGFGKVPAYIYRRKFELLKEDLQAKQNVQCQAEQDYEQMADMERQMVISGLQDYWGRLLQEYNSLSLNEDGNERQRELRQNLEARMKEVEADLKLLSGSNLLFVGDVNASHYL